MNHLPAPAITIREERITRLVNTVSVSLTARNKQGMLAGVLFGLTDYAYWL